MSRLARQQGARQIDGTMTIADAWICSECVTGIPSDQAACPFCGRHNNGRARLIDDRSECGQAEIMPCGVHGQPGNRDYTSIVECTCAEPGRWQPLGRAANRWR